jgi:hypothetical protein
MSRLIKLLTDSEITVLRIKNLLYLNGVSSITKNGFQSGASAGFGGGAPATLDLFIDSDDKKKTDKIISEMKTD